MGWLVETVLLCVLVLVFLTLMVKFVSIWVYTMYRMRRGIRFDLYVFL